MLFTRQCKNTNLNEQCAAVKCARGSDIHLTWQSVALRLILVPLTVEIHQAALAVGELAAHLLVPHGTLREVTHVLQKKKGEDRDDRTVKQKL